MFNTGWRTAANSKTIAANKHTAHLSKQTSPPCTLLFLVKAITANVILVKFCRCNSGQLWPMQFWPQSLLTCNSKEKRLSNVVEIIWKGQFLHCSISMEFRPVPIQRAWWSTDIFTVGAFVRFFSSVRSFVDFQCGCPRGREITVVTFVGFFSSVYSFVVLQCTWSRKW